MRVCVFNLRKGTRHLLPWRVIFHIFLKQLSVNSFHWTWTLPPRRQVERSVWLSELSRFFGFWTKQHNGFFILVATSGVLFPSSVKPHTMALISLLNLSSSYYGDKPSQTTTTNSFLSTILALTLFSMEPIYILSINHVCLHLCACPLKWP